MMMRRREFVVGCLSTAVAGEAFGHSCDVPSDVGAYYAAYLETVAARVRANAQTCDTGFWFLTDPHVKANHRKSGRLCADLIARTGLRRVLCGGDLPVAFADGHTTDKAAVDFASAHGRILLDITGHHHAERQTFQNGILHVTEPCDAYYGNYINGSAPWCGDLPRKKGGTVYEQTFDAVQIERSRKYVRFTRVGGGQDRVIHLSPRIVRVGETVRFEPSFFAGPTTFGCYDGDCVSFPPNPQNRWSPLVAYKTTFAEISPTGVLTAHRPGPVMALAMDAHLNKEIFPVQVIA